MKKSQAIKRAGSVAELAKLLGITHQAVYKWGASMPPRKVEALKALRPQWFGSAK